MPGSSAIPGGVSGRVVTPDQVYAVTLPEGWQSVSLDPGGLGPVASALPSGDIIAKQWLEVTQGGAIQAGSTLLALDTAALRKDGSLVSVAVTRVPNLSAELEPLASQVKAFLAKDKAVSGLTMTSVALPTGPAYRYDYRYTITSPVLGKNGDMVGVKYLSSSSGLYSYALTFTGPYADRATVGPVFEQIAKAFLIL